MQIEKYRARISGPLLDRISIHVTVRPADVEAFTEESRGDSSRRLREQAVRAREIQRERTWGNARLPESLFATVCPMTADASQLLVRAHKSLRISARGRAHVIRVSRTIADLQEVETIAAEHVAEAIQYRMTVSS